jgi:hypothetical protein
MKTPPCQRARVRREQKDNVVNKTQELDSPFAVLQSAVDADIAIGNRHENV